MSAAKSGVGSYVIDAGRLPAAAQAWVRCVRATPAGGRDRSLAIYDRLSRVTFGHRSLSFCANWTYVPLRERRRLLREVDDLHREGVPWPHMQMGRWDATLGDYAFEPFLPRVDPEERRSPTRRPDHLPYCVYWTGAYWAPAHTPRRRREAGYVGLLMCWPPPLPAAGTYLLSGTRARFAYRICETERFARPRTARRYTCRLWCLRTDPRAVPRDAIIHPFYWHARR